MHQLNVLTTRRHAHGFSLLEILVALLVLSIGLLGLAGMQMVGLRSTNSASFRGQAVAVATDLAERMRINPRVLNNDLEDINDDGIVDAVDTNDYFNNPTADCSTAVAQCNTGADCSPLQMAVYDFNTLACGANGVSLLPEGAITVRCVDAATGVDLAACPDSSLFRVSVSWKEMDGTPQAIDVTVLP